MELKKIKSKKCTNCNNIKQQQTKQDILTKYNQNKTCLDCNTIIQNDSIRCIKCYKIAKKDGKHEKVKNIDKSTKNCPDCNKIISKKSIRCRLCNYTLLKEKSNTDNKNIEKGKCIDCSKDIDYKAIRCLICSKKIIEEANSKLDNKCIDCNKSIWNTAKRCIECYNIKSRKVERPTYEQLIKDREELNLVQIGRKYNVADNTIRKWIKRYEYLRSQESK